MCDICGEEFDIEKEGIYFSCEEDCDWDVCIDCMPRDN